jgi:hypothetical protein
MHARTVLNMEKTKRDAQELAALVSRYERKLKLLRENQEIAEGEWAGLQERWKTAEKEIRRDTNKRKSTLIETISSLTSSNTKLEAQWQNLIQFEAHRKAHFSQIQQLKSTLQRQKSQHIRLLMTTALHEILQRKLAVKWSKITTVFETNELETILEKANNLQFRNESLKTNANEVLRYTAGLRTVKLQLLSEANSLQMRQDVDAKPVDTFKTPDKRVNIDQKERFGRVIIASLRKTLGNVLEKDIFHILLPGNINFQQLPLPQLLLIYSKSISTAFEIAKQTPSFLQNRRRSTLFAKQLQLQSTNSKSKSSTSPHSLHILSRKHEKMRVEFGDLSLFATASHYEQAAISSARSVPVLSYCVEEGRDLIRENEELEQLRTLQRTYKQGKRDYLHSPPIITKSATTVSIRSFCREKHIKTAKLARDLVEMDKERQRLMKRNREVQLQGSRSFRELRSGIGSWKVGIKRVQIARTAESSPQISTRSRQFGESSKRRIQLPPSQPHSSTTSTLPSPRSPGPLRSPYPAFPSFHPA